MSAELQSFTVEKQNVGGRWVKLPATYLANYDSMKGIIGRMSTGNKDAVYRLLQGGVELSRWQGGCVVKAGSK